ncbi:MAG: DUF47 family protein [Desulfovibrionaceae bacterium]|nr:DUF47 family protein [Desulfovibrionaceae bacterium]
MFPYLLPKAPPFFDMLKEQNAQLRSIGEWVVRMLEDDKNKDQAHKEIAILEAAGDKLHGKILRELSKAFITPIDREDILRINQSQENSMDALQRLDIRLHIFEFPRIRFPMLQLARLANDMLSLTSVMLNGLSHRKDCHKTHAFRSLRDEADMVMATGIAELMDENRELTDKELLRALKWSQAYERMDSALEHINTLAETIEEAVLKHV